MRVRDQAFSAENPLVSISCISFNQAQYIGKCIEGFLDQVVDFSVEILLHDDASTDGTAEIILDYAKRYPHLIKPLLQKENQFKKGVRCIHAVFNFSRSKGVFIATCEGDDYWIDESKLSQQVRFLQQHSDYTMSCHDTYVGYWNEKKTIRTAASIVGRNFLMDGPLGLLKLLKRVLNWNGDFWLSRRIKFDKTRRVLVLPQILEMYQSTIFIPTVSIVGNGEMLRNIPALIFDSPTGHKEHIFWLAIHGKTFYFNEVWGQKINQMNSLTQTRIHKNDTHSSDKQSSIRNYLARFLDLDIPEHSKKLIESFVTSNG